MKRVLCFLGFHNLESSFVENDEAPAIMNIMKCVRCGKMFPVS